jgi:hypothetical protein
MNSDLNLLLNLKNAQGCIGEWRHSSGGWAILLPAESTSLRFSRPSFASRPQPAENDQASASHLTSVARQSRPKRAARFIKRRKWFFSGGQVADLMLPDGHVQERKSREGHMQGESFLSA